jgi:two-component system, cell cycle response regulator CpdR
MARILLADDEAATRELLKRALSNDGHEIVVAEDGQEALEHLQNAAGKFDLLISDVQMPVLDGISLAEKAIAGSPGLPIILMSAHANGFARGEALRPQLKAMLTKPFTLEYIKATVKAALA